MLMRDSHASKRKHSDTKSEPTNYHGMLNQLDSLIQRKRLLKSDEQEPQQKKKQKIIHTGQIHRTTSERGPKIDSVQNLNPFLRNALKDGMKFTHLLSIQNETLPHS